MLKIKKLEIKIPVFDITIDDNHNFYANDILVHNCQETMLPTYPIKNTAALYKNKVIPEEDGEIALCNLGAIVAGKTDPSEYEEIAYILLKAVDNTISIMDYPYPSLKYTAQNRRSIGIGIIDFAHRMAIENKKYDEQEGLEFIHDWAEMHSYYLIKASLKLGKEKGNAPWIQRTKYSKGILPISYYNKNVDSIVESTHLKFDWVSLSKEVKDNGGIRNSVLVAHMPSEKSSMTTGSTNGLYPIRSFQIIKSDGSDGIRFFPGGYNDLFTRINYQFAFDIKMEDMVKVYAIFQKFTGQGISADFWYNPKLFKDGKMGLVYQFKLLALMNKFGMKSHYYFNNFSETTGSNTVEEDDGCESGACKI